MNRMLCQIADLIVEIPTSGAMDSRCKDYLCQKDSIADIRIRDDLYKMDTRPNLSESDIAYIDSGAQFYTQLLKYNGLMLHASAVELYGKAYLFSGPSGMGKSTHAHFWQEIFGQEAQIFNDDKPALRRLDDVWYAYGTPWCGKDGINQNKKVLLAGICFLKRGQKNEIRRLDKKESSIKVLRQTIHHFRNEYSLDLLLGHIEKLIQEIPIYELKCCKETAAAHLSYETMVSGAKEMDV